MPSKRRRRKRKAPLNRNVQKDLVIISCTTKTEVAAKSSCSETSNVATHEANETKDVREFQNQDSDKTYQGRRFSLRKRQRELITDYNLDSIETPSKQSRQACKALGLDSVRRDSHCSEIDQTSGTKLVTDKEVNKTKFVENEIDQNEQLFSDEAMFDELECADVFSSNTTDKGSRKCMPINSETSEHQEYSNRPESFKPEIECRRDPIAISKEEDNRPDLTNPGIVKGPDNLFPEVHRDSYNQKNDSSDNEDLVIVPINPPEKICSNIFEKIESSASIQDNAKCHLENTECIFNPSQDLGKNKSVEVDIDQNEQLATDEDLFDDLECEEIVSYSPCDARKNLNGSEPSNDKNTVDTYDINVLNYIGEDIDILELHSDKTKGSQNKELENRTESTDSPEENEPFDVIELALKDNEFDLEVQVLESAQSNKPQDAEAEKSGHLVEKLDDKYSYSSRSTKVDISLQDVQANKSRHIVQASDSIRSSVSSSRNRKVDNLLQNIRADRLSSRVPGLQYLRYWDSKNAPPYFSCLVCNLPQIPINEIIDHLKRKDHLLHILKLDHLSEFVDLKKDLSALDLFKRIQSLQEKNDAQDHLKKLQPSKDDVEKIIDVFPSTLYKFSESNSDSQDLGKKVVKSKVKEVQKAIDNILNKQPPPNRTFPKFKRIAILAGTKYKSYFNSFCIPKLVEVFILEDLKMGKIKNFIFRTQKKLPSKTLWIAFLSCDSFCHHSELKVCSKNKCNHPVIELSFKSDSHLDKSLEIYKNHFYSIRKGLDSGNEFFFAPLLPIQIHNINEESHPKAHLLYENNPFVHFFSGSSAILNFKSTLRNFAEHYIEISELSTYKEHPMKPYFSIFKNRYQNSDKKTPPWTEAVVNMLISCLINPPNDDLLKDMSNSLNKLFENAIEIPNVSPVNVTQDKTSLKPLSKSLIQQKSDVYSTKTSKEESKNKFETIPKDVLRNKASNDAALRSKELIYSFDHVVLMGKALLINKVAALSSHLDNCSLWDVSIPPSVTKISLRFSELKKKSKNALILVIADATLMTGLDIYAPCSELNCSQMIKYSKSQDINYKNIFESKLLTLSRMLEDYRIGNPNFTILMLPLFPTSVIDANLVPNKLFHSYIHSLVPDFAILGNANNTSWKLAIIYLKKRWDELMLATIKTHHHLKTGFFECYFQVLNWRKPNEMDKGPSKEEDHWNSSFLDFLQRAIESHASTDTEKSTPIVSTSELKPSNDFISNVWPSKKNDQKVQNVPISQPFRSKMPAVKRNIEPKKSAINISNGMMETRNNELFSTLVDLSTRIKYGTNGSIYEKIIFICSPTLVPLLKQFPYHSEVITLDGKGIIPQRNVDIILENLDYLKTSSSICMVLLDCLYFTYIYTHDHMKCKNRCCREFTPFTVPKNVSEIIKSITELVARANKILPSLILPLYPQVAYQHEKRSPPPHKCIYNLPMVNHFLYGGKYNDWAAFMSTLKNKWSNLLVEYHKNFPSYPIAKKYALEKRDVVILGDVPQDLDAQWSEQNAWKEWAEAFLTILLKHPNELKHSVRPMENVMHYKPSTPREFSTERKQASWSSLLPSSTMFPFSQKNNNIPSNETPRFGHLPDSQHSYNRSTQSPSNADMSMSPGPSTSRASDSYNMQPIFPSYPSQTRPEFDGFQPRQNNPETYFSAQSFHPAFKSQPPPFPPPAVGEPLSTPYQHQPFHHFQ